MSDTPADNANEEAISDSPTRKRLSRGERYDLILDAKTDRSPFAYARALRPNGTYVTGQSNNGSATHAFSTTGGTITPKLCCSGPGATDFPGSCSVGACSCSATNSKMFSTCDCGSGCFDQDHGCVSYGDSGF